MTTIKHDCIQFVKRHEREAHDKTRQEHGKRRSMIKERSLKKYDWRMSAIQDDINRLQTRIVDLLTDMKEDPEVKFHISPYTSQTLAKMESGKWIESIAGSCQFGDEMREAEESESKAIDLIADEYAKVYALITPMRSARKITDTLEELGFDVTDLRDDNRVKALTPQINTKLLGI